MGRAYERERGKANSDGRGGEGGRERDSKSNDVKGRSTSSLSISVSFNKSPSLCMCDTSMRRHSSFTFSPVLNMLALCLTKGRYARRAPSLLSFFLSFSYCTASISLFFLSSSFFLLSSSLSASPFLSSLSLAIPSMVFFTAPYAVTPIAFKSPSFSSARVAKLISSFKNIETYVSTSAKSRLRTQFSTSFFHPSPPLLYSLSPSSPCLPTFSPPLSPPSLSALPEWASSTR
mmetsp:Transcript_42994/g.111098  ORF Transcript_42994/g.111098 Transcript_42994/m.111098 type:complete len:232 (-) Transcript_42994:1530-2225(-)